MSGRMYDFADEYVYTSVMKRAAAIAVSILFLANTTLVSAWAPRCGHDVNGSSSAGEAQVAPDVHAPCRQAEEEKKPDNNRCEGLCLCAHVSANPSFFLKSGDGVRLPLITGRSFATDNNTPAPVDWPPLDHPPKHIS